MNRTSTQQDETQHQDQTPRYQHKKSSPLKPSNSTTVGPKKCNIEVLKEEVNKSIKEIYENTK